MTLDELIAAVEESAAGDPLQRISAAGALKVQLEALGDELLDHFVMDAREQGCSWAQVGQALGVTRQAAQQRHGGLLGRLVQRLIGGKFNRFTKRARAAVIAAQAAARDRGHECIGTEHVLLGLANDDHNVAMVALGRLGVDRAALERMVDARRLPGEHPQRGHLRFNPNAKKTLELALREAGQLGHDYIGCEHILLALRLLEDGLAAEILAELDVSYDDLRTAVVAVLTDPAAG